MHYVMDLPQVKSAEGRSLLKAEYWRKFEYLDANSILILCDYGGNNNACYYIFKERLQMLADKIGIKIRIVHFPPYTSKYNPVELGIEKS